MFIKLIEDRDSHEAGEVVEVGPGYGEALVEQGKAEEVERLEVKLDKPKAEKKEKIAEG